MKTDIAGEDFFLKKVHDSEKEGQFFIPEFYGDHNGVD